MRFEIEVKIILMTEHAKNIFLWKPEYIIGRINLFEIPSDHIQECCKFLGIIQSQAESVQPDVYSGQLLFQIDVEAPLYHVIADPMNNVVSQPVRLFQRKQRTQGVVVIIYAETMRTVFIRDVK